MQKTTHPKALALCQNGAGQLYEGVSWSAPSHNTCGCRNRIQSKQRQSNPNSELYTHLEMTSCIPSTNLSVHTAVITLPDNSVTD